MEPSSPNNSTNSPISGAAFKRFFGREHVRLIGTFVAALVLVSGLGLWYRHDAATTVSSSRQQLAEDARVLAGLVRTAPDQPEILGEIQHRAVSMQDSLSSITNTARGNWLSARILDYAPIDVGLDDSVLQQAYLLSVEVTRRAEFWGAFTSATAEIVVYDADADLRGIFPDPDGPELVRRMYLAKGGLLRAHDHMAVALAHAGDQGEVADIDRQITRLLEIVDTVISATMDSRFSEAAVARTAFVVRISELQRVVRTYRAAHQERAFLDLQKEADETAQRLSESHGK